MNEWWDASTFNLTDLVRLIRFVKEDQKAVSYDRRLRDDEFLRIDEFGTHDHGKCFTILMKRKYFNKVTYRSQVLLL